MVFGRHKGLIRSKNKQQEGDNATHATPGSLNRAERRFHNRKVVGSIPC